MGAAVAGLGVSMPSCPGQKALQQQVDTLQASNVAMDKKLNAMDAQVKALLKNEEDAQARMKQFAEAIDAQRTALVGLQTSVENLAKSKPSAKASPAKSSAKKRR
jgi:hypothetical protein